MEKLYYLINPDFIGRDRFIELMMQLGYRLKVRKNYRRTTRSIAWNYPNLIKGMLVDAPNKVWQSDITYFHVGDRYYYAVFIIDVYTKRIVGHQVSDHMMASANITALKTAIKQNQAPQYHHSDRGAQYGASEYLELLSKNGTKVSMGEKAQDNAYAERINGTIKNEYINYWKPKNFQQLKIMVNRAVKQYNTKRLHKSLKRETPEGFEQKWFRGMLSPKPLITIFNKVE